LKVEPEDNLDIAVGVGVDYGDCILCSNDFRTGNIRSDCVVNGTKLFKGNALGIVELVTFSLAWA
jgi:hypothetical protein